MRCCLICPALEQKCCPDFAFLPKLDLSDIYRTDRGAFLDVWLPLAHRVWVGEKTHVTLDDLLAALKTADIKERIRCRLLDVLQKKNQS